MDASKKKEESTNAWRFIFSCQRKKPSQKEVARSKQTDQVALLEIFMLSS